MFTGKGKQKAGTVITGASSRIPGPVQCEMQVVPSVQITPPELQMLDDQQASSGQSRSRASSLSMTTQQFGNLLVDQTHASPDLQVRSFNILPPSLSILRFPGTHCCAT